MDDISVLALQKEITELEQTLAAKKQQLEEVFRQENRKYGYQPVSRNEWVSGRNSCYAEYCKEG